MVDALSRHDSLTSEILALSAANFVVSADLRQEVNADAELAAIAAKIADGLLGAPWGLLVTPYFCELFEKF